jgi:hypothetical protein
VAVVMTELRYIACCDIDTVGTCMHNACKPDPHDVESALLKADNSVSLCTVSKVVCTRLRHGWSRLNRMIA